MNNINKTLLFIVFFAMSISSHSQNDINHSKTLQHVLLFQWAKDANPDAKSEVLSLFKGLSNKIEGMHSFEILEVTTSSGNYDQVLIFEFATEEALKRYDEHPDHLRVKTLAPPLISGFASYDYWV